MIFVLAYSCFSFLSKCILQVNFSRRRCVPKTYTCHKSHYRKHWIFLINSYIKKVNIFFELIELFVMKSMVALYLHIPVHFARTWELSLFFWGIYFGKFTFWIRISFWVYLSWNRSYNVIAVYNNMDHILLGRLELCFNKGKVHIIIIWISS